MPDDYQGNHTSKVADRFQNHAMRFISTEHGVGLEYKEQSDAIASYDGRVLTIAAR
ncbi:MAG: hypothetical protein JXA69_05620 [Phycisphaerae bacterium]|nr:hypothetical protein [Phycisphaerae bacterium]